MKILHKPSKKILSISLPDQETFKKLWPNQKKSNCQIFAYNEKNEEILIKIKEIQLI